MLKSKRVAEDVFCDDFAERMPEPTQHFSIVEDALRRTKIQEITIFQRDRFKISQCRCSTHHTTYNFGRFSSGENCSIKSLEFFGVASEALKESGDWKEFRSLEAVSIALDRFSDNTSLYPYVRYTPIVQVEVPHQLPPHQPIFDFLRNPCIRLENLELVGDFPLQEVVSFMAVEFGGKSCDLPPYL
jgi:hypothetical protein